MDGDGVELNVTREPPLADPTLAALLSVETCTTRGPADKSIPTPFAARTRWAVVMGMDTDTATRGDTGREGKTVRRPPSPPSTLLSEVEDTLPTACGARRWVLACDAVVGEVYEEVGAEGAYDDAGRGSGRGCGCAEEMDVSVTLAPWTEAGPADVMAAVVD